MKNIKVVIGANFGDEGKGLITDYLASKAEKGIVVRFNGGCQAGHTVVTPDNIRHVFGHLGAGTFAGLPTYLSEHFIVNPMVFRKEFEGLKKKGLSPKVFVNQRCLVTTPYDVLVNQIVETVRSGDKHGSCGLGIFETLFRNKAIPLRIFMLRDERYTQNQLQRIRESYVMGRLLALNVTAIPIEFIDLLSNSNIIENYLEDIKFMMNNVTMVDDRILADYDDVIFEGGQGLLLDQNNTEYFPHLTPSNTGMENVATILKGFAKTLNFNISDFPVEINYVTRQYLTRHGAGKFPTQLVEKPYSKIVDLTNIYNPYQENIRFGLLDIADLSSRINADLQHAKGLNYKVQIAVTCLDQMDNCKYMIGGVIRHESCGKFFKDIVDVTGIKYNYLSYGMTRETIKEGR